LPLSLSHAFVLLQLHAELFRAPEVLFRPEILGLEYGGVHETLTTSIEKCDMDLRRTLYSQIVMSGGSTLFPGLFPNFCGGFVA